jgi:hypothetical protein
MIAVKSDDLWNELEKFADHSTGIKAAVAYVSDDSSIRFGRGDVLVVDASDDTIASGGTSAKVLSRAFDAGASLFAHDGLHAKVVVCDGRAYIGSANVTKNSKKLLEIGVISDHPSILSGATQFVEKLVEISETIDIDFIERIKKIEVKKGRPRGNASKKITIDVPRTWLISVRNDAKYPGDVGQVARDSGRIETKSREEANWFYLTRDSRCYDQAKVGDSVVVIYRADSASTEPDFVCRHSTIQKVTLDHGIKSYHYAWSKNDDITWREFADIAVRAGVSGLGKGLNTMRELSERKSSALFELWRA